MSGSRHIMLFCFFFNDTATTEIYTLSLHDALPIYGQAGEDNSGGRSSAHASSLCRRSEEHTSELQSRENLVCRLLLEKKTKKEVFPSLCKRYDKHFAILSSIY